MNLNLDIINIFISIVVVLNLALGIFIYFTKKSDEINQSFFLFLIAATFWSSSMFFYRTYAGTEVSVLFTRILYLSAAVIPFVFLFFIRVFPEDKFSMSKKSIAFLAIPFLGISLISILPNFLILGTTKPIHGENIIIFDNFLHTIYALYITIYFSICYVLLFIKYFKFKGTQRVQITYVILGTLISTIIGVITNLILPYIGDFSLNWLGQIGIIVMISSISYSILQHKLFDMKVVATQFIVFILCTALFARVLFSTNQSDLFINSAFLIIIIIVGFFLVRGVIKEVRLREQLDISNNKLLEANQAQTSLIHFMNHQVKGRFGNAKNIFAELLTNDYGDMPESTKPLLQKGLEETTMGVDYVQNILRGASAESGKLPYEMKPLDFRKIVEESFERQKGFAEQKGLKISLSIDDGEYKMNGDARELGEATRNMIENSINYTPEGSIEIKLSGDKYAIKLSIKDTGVGLSSDDKNNLFKSGGRGAESIKININSTGYGLAFVKGVVDAHKGRVWAESEGRGKGSVFSLELPKS